MVESHKDLVAWQKSVELVTQVYILTRTFLKRKCSD